MAHATVRFRDVDVLKVGNWTGGTGEWDVTEQDLHDIVAASQDKLIHREIPVKVGQGHRDVNLSREMDGDAPAYGWVKDLRVDKDDEGTPTLYATVEDVPYDLGVSIRDHYQGRSVEAALGVTTQAGTRYGAVLEALAFLGQEQPAVAGLQPLPQFSRMSRGESTERRVSVVIDADEDNGEDTTVTPEQIKAALEALPEDERTTLLASVAQPAEGEQDPEGEGQGEAGEGQPEAGQDGATPDPAPEATPAAPAAPAEPAAGGAQLSRGAQDEGDKVTLSRGEHTALLSRLTDVEAKYAKLSKDQHETERKALLSAAVASHKIATDPDTVKFWEDQYDTNPENTTTILERMGVTVPQGQRGADLAHEAGPAEDEAKRARIAAAIAYQTGQPVQN